MSAGDRAAAPDCCPTHGCELEAVECQHCFGEGGFHDCGEDCCVCLDKEEITVDCSECHGKGFYLLCPTCAPGAFDDCGPQPASRICSASHACTWASSAARSARSTRLMSADLAPRVLALAARCAREGLDAVDANCEPLRTVSQIVSGALAKEPT